MLVDAVNRLCTFPSLFTHRLATRTNIDIDDELIARVMLVHGVRTKSEAVDLALRRLHAFSRSLADTDDPNGIG